MIFRCLHSHVLLDEIVNGEEARDSWLHPEVVLQGLRLPLGEVVWLEREHTGDCGENEWSQWELQLQLRETMFPSLLMQVLRNLSLPEAGHCPLLTSCLTPQVPISQEDRMEPHCAGTSGSYIKGLLPLFHV